MAGGLYAGPPKYRTILIILNKFLFRGKEYICLLPYYFTGIKKRGVYQSASFYFDSSDNQLVKEKLMVEAVPAVPDAPVPE